MRGYLFEAFGRVASQNLPARTEGAGFDVMDTSGYGKLFSNAMSPMELKQMYSLGTGASAIAKAIVADPNQFTVSKMAKGGKASGTDTVPALLTPGEFVVNRSSAQSYGYGNLQSINKYAQGGIVSSGKHFYGAGPPGIGKLFGGLMKKTKPLAAGMGKLQTGVSGLTAATGSATQALMPMAQNMMMLSMMLPSVMASFEGLKDGIGLSDILNLGMTAAFVWPQLKALGPTLSGLAIGAQAFGKGFKRGGQQKMGLVGRLNRGVAGATKGKVDINNLAKRVEVGTYKAIRKTQKYLGKKFDSLKTGFKNFRAGLGGSSTPVTAQLDWNKFQKSMKGSGLKSGKGAGTFSEAFKAQKAPTKALKLGQSVRGIGKTIKESIKSGGKILSGAIRKAFSVSAKGIGTVIKHSLSTQAKVIVGAGKIVGKTITGSFKAGSGFITGSVKKIGELGGKLGSSVSSLGKSLSTSLSSGGKKIGGAFNKAFKSGQKRLGGIFKDLGAGLKGASKAPSTAALNWNKFRSSMKGLGLTKKGMSQAFKAQKDVAAKAGPTGALKAGKGIREVGKRVSKAFKTGAKLTGKAIKAPFQIGAKAIKGSASLLTKASKSMWQASKFIGKSGASLAKTSAKFGTSAVKGLSKASATLAKASKSFGLKTVSSLKAASSKMVAGVKKLPAATKNFGVIAKQFGVKAIAGLKTVSGKLATNLKSASTTLLSAGKSFGLKSIKGFQLVSTKLATTGKSFGLKLFTGLKATSATLAKAGKEFGLKSIKGFRLVSSKLATTGKSFGIKTVKGLANASTRLAKVSAKFGLKSAKQLGNVSVRFGKVGAKFGLKAAKQLGSLSARLGKVGAQFGLRGTKEIAKVSVRLGKVGAKFGLSAVKQLGSLSARLGKVGAKFGVKAVTQISGAGKQFAASATPVLKSAGQKMGSGLLKASKSVLSSMKRGSNVIGKTLKSGAKLYGQTVLKFPNILAKSIKTTLPSGMSKVVKPTIGQSLATPKGQKLVGQGKNILKHMQKGAKAVGKQFRGASRAFLKGFQHQGQVLGKIAAKGADFGAKAAKGMTRAATMLGKAGQKIGGPMLSAAKRIGTASAQFGKVAQPMVKQLATGLKAASKNMVKGLASSFKKSANFMSKRLASTLRSASPAAGAAGKAGVGMLKGAGGQAANLLKAMKQGGADLSKKLSSSFIKAGKGLGKVITKTGGRFAVGASSAIQQGGNLFGKQAAKLGGFSKQIGAKIASGGAKMAGQMGSVLSKGGSSLLKATKGMAKFGKGFGQRFVKAGGKAASKLQSVLGPAFSKGASLLSTSLQKVGSLGATVGKSVAKASSKMGAVINGAFKSSSEVLRSSISSAGAKLSEFGGVLKGRIGEAAKSFTTRASSMFSTASKGLKGAITSAGGKLSSAFSGLKGTFTSITGTLGKGLRTAFTKSSTVMKTAIGSSFKGGLNVAKGFGESIKRGAGSFGNSIKGVFQNAGKTISTKFGAVTSGLGKHATSFKTAIVDGASSMTRGLGKRFSSMKSGLGESFKKLGSTMTKKFGEGGFKFANLIPKALQRGATNTGAAISKKMTPGLVKVLGPKLGAKIAGGMVKGGPWGLVASLVADPMIDFVGGGIRDLISGKAVTIAPGVTGRRNESVAGAAIGEGAAGAAKGAVSGALIGSIFAPFTFGLSTLIGGIIGATVGGIQGLLQGAAKQIEFEAFDKLKDSVEDAMGPLEELGNMTSFDASKVEKANAATNQVFEDMGGAYQASIDRGNADLISMWDAVNPLAMSGHLADGMTMAGDLAVKGAKATAGLMAGAVDDDTLNKGMGALTMGVLGAVTAFTPIGPAVGGLVVGMGLAGLAAKALGVDTSGAQEAIGNFAGAVGKGVMAVADFGMQAGAAVIDWARPGVSEDERKLANVGAEGFWAQGASTFDNTLSRIPIISALTGAKGRVKSRAKEGSAKIERKALDKTLTMMTDDFVEAVNTGFTNAIQTAGDTLADIDMSALDAIVDIDLDPAAAAMAGLVSPSEQFTDALKSAGDVLGDSNLLLDQFANVVRTRVLANVKADIESNKTLGDEKGQRTAQLAGRLVMEMDATEMAEMSEADIKAKVKGKLTDAETDLGVSEEDVAKQIMNTRKAAQEEIQASLAMTKAAKEAAKLASIIDALGQGLDKFAAIAEQGVAKFQSFASSMQEGFDRAFSTEATMLSTEGSRTNAFENMETATPEEIDKAFSRIEANAGGGPGGANAAAFAGLKETAKMSTELPMALKKATESITSGADTQAGFSSPQEADEQIMKALAAQGIDTSKVPAVVLDQMSKSIKATFAARQASGATGPIQMTDLLEEGGEVASILGELADKTKESLASFTNSLNEFESAVIEAANIQIQMAEKIKEADLKKIAIADQLAEITGRDKGKSKLDVATEKFQRQQQVQLGATGVLGTSSFIPGAAPGTGLDATALGERRASLEARSAGIREKLGIGADVNPADADLGNVADMQPLVDELASVETALGGTKTAMEQLASDTTRLAAINSTLKDIEMDKMSAQGRLLQMQKDLVAAMKAGDVQKIQEIQEQIRAPAVALEKFQRGEQLSLEENVMLAENADQLADQGKIDRDQVPELKAAAAAGFAASDQFGQLLSPVMTDAEVTRQRGETGLGRGGMTRPGQETTEEAALRAEAEGIAQQQTDAVDISTDLALAEVAKMQKRYNEELERSKQALFDAGTALKQFREGAAGTAAAGRGGAGGAGASAAAGGVAGGAGAATGGAGAATGGAGAGASPMGPGGGAGRTTVTPSRPLPVVTTKPLPVVIKPSPGTRGVPDPAAFGAPKPAPRDTTGGEGRFGGNQQDLMDLGFSQSEIEEAMKKFRGDTSGPEPGTPEFYKKYPDPTSPDAMKAEEDWMKQKKGPEPGTPEFYKQYPDPSSPGARKAEKSYSQQALDGMDPSRQREFSITEVDTMAAQAKQLTNDPHQRALDAAFAGPQPGTPEFYKQFPDPTSPEAKKAEADFQIKKPALGRRDPRAQADGGFFGQTGLTPEDLRFGGDPGATQRRIGAGSQSFEDRMKQEAQTNQQYSGTAGAARLAQEAGSSMNQFGTSATDFSSVGEGLANSIANIPEAINLNANVGQLEVIVNTNNLTSQFQKLVEIAALEQVQQQMPAIIEQTKTAVQSQMN